MRLRFSSRSLGIVFATVAMLVGSMNMPRAALAAEAAGSAFGEQVGVDATMVLVGSATATSGPLPSVAASGQEPFGPVVQTAASVVVELLGTNLLETGLLSATTFYEGLPTGTSSEGSVEGLEIDLQLTPLVPLASLLADEVTAEAQVSGACGALQASGTTSLENARLVALNLATIELDAQPQPNTFIDVSAALGLAATGVGLFLNEQTVDGDGVTSRSISVNAIRLELNVDVLNVLTLAGEITVGHAQASVDCGTADLSVEKLADPSPVVLGELLEYRIVVTNAGPDPAQTATLVDELDPTFQVQGLDPGAADCELENQTVDCTWDSIPSGESREVRILVLPTATGDIANTARVSTVDFDPDPGNNESTVVVEVVAPSDPEADLAVRLTLVPETVPTGSQSSLLAIVENLGPNVADDPSLAIAIPPSFAIVAVQVAEGGTCQTGATVSCAWQSFASGSGATVQLTLEALDPGLAVVSAETGSTTFDPDLSNNVDSVDVTVTESAGLPEADLEATKRAVPVEGTVGLPLVYQIRVRNLGPEAATDVSVDDVLPSSVEFRQASATDGGTCAFSAPTVRCQWQSIAAGGEVFVTIVVIPQVAGTVLNTVIATTPTIDDPDPENNVFTLETPILDGFRQCAIDRMTDVSSQQMPTHDLHHAGKSVLLSDLVGGPDVGTRRDVYRFDALYRLLSERLTTLPGPNRLTIVGASDDLRIVLGTIRSDPNTGAQVSDPQVVWIDVTEGRLEVLDVLLPEPDEPHRHLALSGDGERVLALLGGSGGVPELTVFGPRDAQMEPVMSFTANESSWPDYLVMNADASTFAFLGRLGPGEVDASEVPRIFVSGDAIETPVVVASQTGAIVPQSLSASGKRLAYIEIEGGDVLAPGRLWLLDTASGATELAFDERIRSPHLTRNGDAVVYLRNVAATGAPAEWNLERAELESPQAVLSMAQFGADEPTVQSIDATGFRATLSSESPPVGLVVPGEGWHAYIVDCFRPRQGLWWNPGRNGNGSDISLGDQDILSKAWFTYEPDGTPAWYFASAPLLGRSWQADLLRVVRGTDESFESSVVGDVYLAFENSHETVFAWQLNGIARSEAWEFFEVHPLPPIIDYTGLWYDPDEPGWGLSVYAFGNWATAIVYFPGADGSPRWVLGVTEPENFGQFEMRAFNGPGLCPTTCAGAAGETASVEAGNVRLIFASRRQGVQDVEIQLPDGLGSWTRTGRNAFILTRPLP